jgi:Asp-tRNA(Asn)/Glu-tRNA(Gln) amidotransferase C subunit
MVDQYNLSKEDVLYVAKTYGLDTDPPHIAELLIYVQKIIPSFRALEELDLTDIEPIMEFKPLK